MDKRFRIAIMISAAVLLIASSVHFLVPEDNKHYDQITCLVFIAILISVSALIFRTYRSIHTTVTDSLRWLFLFLGMAAWTVSYLVKAITVYLPYALLTYLSHTFRSLGFLMIFLAAIVKFRNLRKEAIWKDKLAGTFAALVVFVIISCLVLLPVLVGDAPFFRKFFEVFNPAAGCFILLFAVTIISASGIEQRSVPWFLISAGLCLWVISDTLLSYFWYVNATLFYLKIVNIPFIGGLLCLGLGACYRKMTAEKEGAGRPPETALPAPMPRKRSKKINKQRKKHGGSWQTSQLSGPL